MRCRVLDESFKRPNVIVIITFEWQLSEGVRMCMAIGYCSVVEIFHTAHVLRMRFSEKQLYGIIFNLFVCVSYVPVTAPTTKGAHIFGS